MANHRAAGLLAGVVCLGGVWVWAQQADPSAGRASLDLSAMTEEQKTSYAVGYIIRQRLDEERVAVDEEALIAGLRSYRGAQPPVMSPEEMGQQLSRYLGSRRGQGTQAESREQGPEQPRQNGDTQRQRQHNQRQQAPGAIDPGGLPPGYGLNLRIDDRVQSPRLDTAVPETKANTARDDADD